MKTTEAQKRITAALNIARYYGHIGGDHHRVWVIDQIVRALTASDYDQWVKSVTTAPSGVDFGIEWDTGIMP